MDNMAKFAMNKLKSAPNIAKNPMAKEFMDILESGDTARGEQMANNILHSMGISREAALQNAMDFFHLN